MTNNMDDLKQLIIIAELDGCQVREYEPYTWTTNIPWDDHPGEFLKCSGYRCKSCGDYHIGNTPYDGYCNCGINPLWLVYRPDWEWVQPKLPKSSNYLNSRDTIISVIEKQTLDVQKRLILFLLGDRLGALSEHFLIVLLSTPRQLCEALIRSVGKWKE